MYKLSITAVPFPLLTISSIYEELLVPGFYGFAVSVHAREHLKSTAIGSSKGFCITGFTFHLSVLKVFISRALFFSPSNG